MSTPYNEDDIDFLDKLGVCAFKLASIHVTEPFLLKQAARKCKPIILSTGMATLSEVQNAVRVIKEEGNNQLILLHCTTNYPSSVSDANLRAMLTMKHSLKTLVGYSDHTQTFTAAILSVGFEASVIERHFTLDKKMPGPDQATSLDPKGFAQFVQKIREAESCLGSGIKEPTLAERKNMQAMRRSIVAKVRIPANTVLTMAHMTLKRPANGLLGNQLEQVLGKKSIKVIPKDAVIMLDSVK